MAKRIKVFVMAVIACVGVLLFAGTAMADVSLPEPQHEKTAVSHGDGTVTIRLDVTGATDTSTTVQNANVFVVLDTSGSMDQSVGGSTRLDIAKAALDAMGNELLGSGAQSGINVTLIPFATRVGTVSGPYGDGSAEAFSNAVNALTADGGTNWEAALQTASNLAAADSGTPAYVVFLSDGMPTYRTSSLGHYDRDWIAGLYGNGSSDPNGWNRDAAVAVANAMPGNVRAIYSVYNGEDAASAMEAFNGALTGSYEKDVYNGTNSASLNAALSNIVQRITQTASYQRVVVTDELSPYVTYALPQDEMLDGGFRYFRAGEPWDGAPAAAFDEAGRVVWDLSSVGQLEHGVTYAVEFDVRLTAAAYAEAAASGQSWVSLPTNNSASLAYDVVKATTSGEPDEAIPGAADYVRPTVDVPRTALTVSKKVAGNMGNTSQDFTFHVAAPDGTYYLSVDGGAAEPVTASGGRVELALHHGQTATVYGLMPGAHTVSEVRDNVTGMTTSANGEELSGSDVGNGQLAFAAAASVPYGTDAGSLEFVNRSDAEPIYGFADNIAPYAGLAALGLGGAGAGSAAFVAKRQKGEE